MKITEKSINKTWRKFTLTNAHGMEVHFLNFGGIITKIIVPDRHGKLENVVLGYRNYEDYKHNPNYFGAIIGRVAGRIENAVFTIDNTTYQLEKNEGQHHLHGGSTGFHQVLWDVITFQNPDKVGAKLSYTSKDGDGGYPGNVDVTVTYTLTNNNQIVIDYHAKTDKKTILTLTNHSYFNLSGQLKDTIEHHYLSMHSNKFAQLDKSLIPTGKLQLVEGTPFDFQTGGFIKRGILSTNSQNELVGNGYDHYFLFNQTEKPQVKITEPKSGRILTVKSTHPGMVMYTANALDNTLELHERQSQPYLGVCLETQEYAASLRHDQFPSVMLAKNEIYSKETILSFNINKD